MVAPITVHAYRFFGEPYVKDRDTVHAYRFFGEPYVKDRVSDGMVNQGGTTRLRPLTD